MVQSQKFNHFLVVTQQEQQINITVPSLFYDEERAAILRIILLKRAAIKDVQVNSKDNSVTIQFDSVELERDTLFNLLDIVLANFSQKPSKNTGKNEGKCAFCDGTMCKVSFSVKGMSCASCALYLELVLSRDKGVSTVNIDYSTKKGLLTGCLTKDEVMAIVEKHGYEAHCED